MPVIKKFDSTEINITTLVEAENVQQGIAEYITRRLHVLRSEDLASASSAAIECNNALTIAEANERAIDALRKRDYVRQTLAASTAFVKYFNIS